ncbi:hypothetical protein RBB79_10560 [Tunturiibacter empetritectus]|uniref:Uncharacterized protein n=1 Tax=Tunturiibacter lichenicola TaxID=2051959 RepID=A0A852VHT0_9BACT|nr:hypothetical protein [Edaphobacter lichenicola]NYF90004.1 hypothetical protein [Edaphobacter lichenicola]
MGRGLLLAGMVVLIEGCHSGPQSDALLNALTSQAQAKTLGPNHLAAEGAAAIVETCGKQSFENARNGLIVSQTGLHEDIFGMRSRTSYVSIAFSLDDALRLEDVLRKKLNENPQPSAEQECVQQFVGYLEALTDPMVEQDKLAKDLDAAAFKDSTREAQEELKREQQKVPPAPSGSK